MHSVPFKAIALVALVALPAVASAQVMRAQAALPSGPVAVRGPGQPQDGITVFATGSAGGEATSAQFTLYIGSRSNANSITAAGLQPVIDALVNSGVDRSSIQIPINLQTPGSHSNNAMISGAVVHPTQAMLGQTMANMTAAFNAQPDYFLGSAQVALKLDDCGAVADASRIDAIRKARARAEATAHDLGVKLGSVLSATVGSPVDANGSCESQFSIPGYPAPQSNDAFNVQVTTSVTLRFAIR